MGFIVLIAIVAGLLWFLGSEKNVITRGKDAACQMGRGAKRVTSWFKRNK